MPTVLQVTYSKKLGLPNYSSHSYTVSITTDVESVAAAQNQSALLYKLLQNQVDEDMKDPGYLPDPQTYARPVPNAKVLSVTTVEADWACSKAQRAMIVAIVDSCGLQKRQVDDLAKELFGGGVRTLNSKQAARFIKELRARHCSKA